MSLMINPVSELLSWDEYKDLLPVIEVPVFCDIDLPPVPS